MRRLLCNAQAQNTFELQTYLSTKLLSNSVVTKVTTLDANAQARAPSGAFVVFYINCAKCFLNCCALRLLGQPVYLRNPSWRRQAALNYQAELEAAAAAKS
jgi:hypothetical protein